MNTWKTTLFIVTLLVLLILVAEFRRLGAEKVELLPQQKSIVPSVTALPVRLDMSGLMHEIHPTLADITNGSIRFLNQKGEAILGYCEVAPGHIKVFSKPSGTGPLGEKVEKVTEDLVVRLTRILQEQATLEAQTAQAKVEEQKRSAHSNEIVRLAAAEENKRQAQKAEAARKAEAEVAYRDHYIGDLSDCSIAVLIVDEAQKQNMALSYSVAAFLSRGGTKTTLGLFKPAFILDGHFDEAFAGQSDALNRIPFPKAARTLLFGRQSVRFSTNSDTPLFILATVSLDINVISATTRQPFFAQSLVAKGPGYSTDEARRIAESRLLEQLTNGILETIEKPRPTVEHNQ